MPVSQRVQMNFIFNDNVRILCLSCNVKGFVVSHLWWLFVYVYIKLYMYLYISKCSVHGVSTSKVHTVRVRMMLVSSWFTTDVMCGAGYALYGYDVYDLKRCSIHIFFDWTRKGWHFNTGNCIIVVITWTGLTVFRNIRVYELSRPNANEVISITLTLSFSFISF
jgi:hypothetical protein